MRQYVNALSIADAEFRAELEQFARWERAAYDDEPWSRTEKYSFTPMYSNCQNWHENKSPSFLTV